MSLEANIQDVTAFINVLFRHANPDGFISLRAFHEKDRGKPPLFTEGVKLGDGERMAYLHRACETRWAEGLTFGSSVHWG